jgi:hypothetical protein
VEHVSGTTEAADSAAHSVLAILGPSGAGALSLLLTVRFETSISAAMSGCILQRSHGKETSPILL